MEREWKFKRAELTYIVIAVFVSGVFFGRVIEDMIDPHIGKFPLLLHLVPFIVMGSIALVFLKAPKAPKAPRAAGKKSGVGGTFTSKRAVSPVTIKPAGANVNETVDADWSIISDDGTP